MQLTAVTVTLMRPMCIPRNEAEVGNAIRQKIAENVVTRSEMFLTTKVCTIVLITQTFVKICHVNAVVNDFIFRLHS